MFGRREAAVWASWLTPPLCVIRTGIGEADPRLGEQRALYQSRSSEQRVLSTIHAAVSVVSLSGRRGGGLLAKPEIFVCRRPRTSGATVAVSRKEVSIWLSCRRPL